MKSTQPLAQHLPPPLGKHKPPSKPFLMSGSRLAQQITLSMIVM
jgi:hypothetical protein